MPSSSHSLTDPLLHTSKEFLADPHPALHQLRSEAPVFWSEKGKYWIITRYADAHHILRDINYEKGVPPAGPVKNFLIHLAGADELKESASHWVAIKNPPEHTRIRSTANKAFTPSMIARMRPLIQEIADKLIEDLQGETEVDLIARYAFPLPVQVIAKMLGVPVQDRDKVHEWSNTLSALIDARPGINPAKIHKMTSANRQFIEYLKPLVEERRQHPQEDLISDLLRAQDHENKLSEEELLANLVFMLIAGHETTVNLISNGVHAFLTHPDQFELVKQNPDLMSHAVEECLRYQSPVQIVKRIAHRDMELAGQTIKEKDLLVLCLGACNRDPDVFPDPDRFDITRKESKHLAFGEGIHFCLGASLARAEGEIALNTLFRKFPGLSLAATTLEYKEPYGLRGFKALPVRLQ